MGIVGAWRLGHRGLRTGAALTLALLCAVLPASRAAASFSAPTTLESAAPAGTPAISDLNGDGMPDVAVPASGGVKVYENTTPVGASTATFAAPVTVPTGMLYPGALTAVDLNGDGRPDLVGASGYDCGCLLAMMNTTPANGATPAFAAPTQIPVDISVQQVVAGDFNGDGRPDLAVLGVYYPPPSGPPEITGPNWGTPAIEVLLNTTSAHALSPSFSARPLMLIPNSGGPFFDGSLAAADITGDGMPDLVLEDRSVYVDTTPRGSATTTFDYHASAGGFFAPFASPLVLADLTGNGSLDLITSSLDLGYAPETWTPDGSHDPFGPMSYIDVRPMWVDAFAVADFDGDGRPDIAASDGEYSGGAGTFVLFNATAPGAATPSWLPPAAFGGLTDSGIQSADFNGDGKPDLLEVRYTGVTVRLNTSQPAAGRSTPQLSYGNTAFGAISDERTVTVTNTGSYELELRGATLAGADPQDFAITSDGCSDQSLDAADPGAGGEPGTYPGGGVFAPGAEYPGYPGTRTGGTCETTVRFRPTTTGARSAQLVIPSDDPASPSIVALSGTGTVAPGAPGGPGPTPVPGVVSIPAQTDVVSHLGATAVLLRCAGSTPCTGTLSLAVPVKRVSRGSRRPATVDISLGHATFNVAGGRSNATALALGRTGFSRVPASGKTVAVIATALTTVGGRHITVTAHIGLRRVALKRARR
jgi:hypothetical protein